MCIKGFTNHVVPDALVFGRVPQVVKLPGVCNEVVKFTNLLVVIHTEFVVPCTEHGPKGTAASREVWVQGIKVLRPHKGTQFVRGCVSTQDWQQAFSLHMVVAFQPTGLEQS